MSEDPGNAFAPTDRTTPVAGAPRALPASKRLPMGVVLTGRTVLAIVSVLALLATGYAWSTLRNAQNGLQTADVLDKGSNTDKPADGSMDILLVGMDSRTDAKGNPLPAGELAQLQAGPNGGELDTDTMILIHIPNGGGKAMGISIPRDSWVSIPGYGIGKINSAYSLAKDKEAAQLKGKGGLTQAQIEVQSDAAGAKETIKTVEQLTGVGIDHYAAINLEGFNQLSNAIGGVPVCLLHPVNDPWSGAKFQAGHFSVQGIQALEFVRQRHNIPGGSTDIEREQRQQAFLASMAHKMLSSGVLTNPGTLNSLISAVQSAVTIDNQWNLIDFAQEMSGMSSGAIKFQTMPVINIDYWPYGQGNGKPSAVEVDPAQVSAFVHGTTGIPAPANASGSQTSQAPTGNAAITVDVQNASGVTGLASHVMSQLTAKGFTQGQTGNVTNRSSSVVFFPAGQESNAQAVADTLNANQFLLEQGSSVPAGHVWVYLGRTYRAETASDVVGGHPQATDIAERFHLASPTTSPSTTSNAPAGGTTPITDNGTAPCVN